MNELEDNLNDYINGTISFLTYRERRTHCITSFVDSGFLPDDTIPLNNIEQQQIKDAVREKIKENAPLDESTYTLQQEITAESAKQYIGLTVLIIAATLAWYFSSQLPEATTTPVTSSQNNQSKTITTSNNEQKKETKNQFDQQFVINFVKMDKWDSDTLSEFLVKWQALSRTHKKQTKQSQSFIRLKNSLRLRVLEQKALQATNNKAAERQENLLIWFASQLSVAIS